MTPKTAVTKYLQDRRWQCLPTMHTFSIYRLHTTTISLHDEEIIINYLPKLFDLTYVNMRIEYADPELFSVIDRFTIAQLESVKNFLSEKLPDWSRSADRLIFRNNKAEIHLYSTYLNIRQSGGRKDKIVTYTDSRLYRILDELR